MSEYKDGWPAKMEILPNPIKAIGRAVCWLFTCHQLASHGDHFQHPLDDVFDHPPYTDGPWKNNIES